MRRVRGVTALAHCFRIFANSERMVSLFALLLLQDFNSHVVDSGIVEDNDAAVGTGFDVDALVFAVFVVATAEVVTYTLHGHVEFVGNAVHRTVGQAVFEATELVECDCFCHSFYLFWVNGIVRFDFRR